MTRNRYEILLAKVRWEYPRFRVRERRGSWLHYVFRVLGALLWLFTIGRVKRDWSTFTTTIGWVMYVGDSWAHKSPDEKYSTLRHETIHVRQFHTWPFGRRWWPVNMCIVALCYLLVLPVALTMRARFEREAYTQTLLVRRELRGKFAAAAAHSWAEWMAETFGGKSWWDPGPYLWMAGREATYRWAAATIQAINDGEIANLRDRVDVFGVSEKRGKA